CCVGCADTRPADPIGERAPVAVPQTALEHPSELPSPSSLTLTRVGRQSEAGPPVRKGTVTVTGSRIEIVHRDDLIEWYEEGCSGIEKGFPLLSPPIGTGPLTVELSLGDDLEAEPAEGAHDVHLRTAQGGAGLHGSALFARDARGRALPATFDASGRRISIR